jgi:hypothetical protein
LAANLGAGQFFVDKLAGVHDALTQSFIVYF